MTDSPEIPPHVAALIPQELTQSDRIRELAATGKWPRTVAGQQELATSLGCSLNLVRKVLRGLNLIGGDPRGGGGRPKRRRPKPSPLTPRTTSAEPGTSDPRLTAALDARDPAQRLELLNALATNRDGSVAPNVQHSALKTIAEEQRSAGSGFGPPPPSTPDEETARILAILRSATPACLQTALSILSAESEASDVLSSPPHMEDPHEPEAIPLEAPPDAPLP